MWTLMLTLVGSAAAQSSDREAHDAIAAADALWPLIRDGDPKGWVRFSAAMADADAVVADLRDPIRPVDAHAYLCLKDRQQRAEAGDVDTAQHTCMEQGERQVGTVGFDARCGGWYGPRGPRRMAPTLRPGQWVVNGRGDCVHQPAMVLQLHRSQGIVVTQVVEPGSGRMDWGDLPAARRRPVAAGIVGAGLLTVAGSAVWFAATGSDFERSRREFSEAPYQPDAGAEFTRQAEQAERRQAAAVVAGAVGAATTLSGAVFFVVEW